MADMYSKLGDLLNDALEKGEIPVNKNANSNVSEENIREKDENEQIPKESTQNKFDNGGTASETIKRKVQFFRKKSDIPLGEVIKMHKYTNNMHIPPEITTALSTLYLVYPTTWRIIQKQYHKLLKQAHPDTKNTIQTSNNVINIEQLQNAYRVLKDFYGK